MIQGGPYRLASWSEIRRIVQGHGWAMLAATGLSGVEVAHVPCLLDPHHDGGGDIEQLVLLGHIGRADPVRAAILSAVEGLLVFTGAHGYVSPTWYGEGTYVPTWNYVTVHARGPLEPLEGEECMDVLRLTVDHFEAFMPTPWSLEAAKKYARQIAGGALAFRIKTTRVTARAKLSQDKPEPIRRRVIKALKREPAGASALAGEMRRVMQSEPDALPEAPVVTHAQRSGPAPLRFQTAETAPLIDASTASMSRQQREGLTTAVHPGWILTRR
jgi:transcriptional regulator